MFLSFRVFIFRLVSTFETTEMKFLLFDIILQEYQTAFTIEVDNDESEK